jgi:hypothetical protein
MALTREAPIPLAMNEVHETARTSADSECICSPSRWSSGGSTPNVQLKPVFAIQCPRKVVVSTLSCRNSEAIVAPTPVGIMRTVQTRSESMSGRKLAGWFLLVAFLGWMASARLAAAAADSVQRLPARAVIHFAGTSTLHDFGGQLPAQPFLLILSNGTWSAAAEVWAGQMATENAKRDHKMHEMLRTNDHPRIQGAVTGAPIPGSAGTNVTLALKICDTTQSWNARVGKWQESADAIRFHAEWELSLKQYGLKPPSVAGVIRVGNTVKLEADVIATKPVPASPGSTTPIP